MENNSILNLNAEEIALVNKINSVFQYSFPETDLLEYTLINVKIQGSAYLPDIMDVSSMGVPMLAIIASMRKCPIAEIVNHLQKGSINFYEFIQALKNFINNLPNT